MLQVKSLARRVNSTLFRMHGVRAVKNNRLFDPSLLRGLVCARLFSDDNRPGSAYTCCRLLFPPRTVKFDFQLIRANYGGYGESGHRNLFVCTSQRLA